jgi:hypothetical protein
MARILRSIETDPFVRETTMTVTGDLLASVTNSTAGAAQNKKAAHNLAAAQSLFGSDRSNFVSMLDNAQQPSDGTRTPIIFNSNLPTNSAAATINAADKSPTSPKLGAALSAYARQSISAGGSQSGSSARVNLPT